MRSRSLCRAGAVLLLSFSFGCGLLGGEEDFLSAAPGAGPGRGANDDLSGAPEAGDDAGNREVEEGDVYRLDGDVLYVLNMYRGLQAIDVRDPDAPARLGTSRILGHPVEMYLRDGYAIVVVSDYFSWWRVDDEALPFHGSQVRILDVRRPEAPVVVGAIDVQGVVTDTRMVGDVLYVVSTRYAWYSMQGSDDDTDELFVASIDLSNPAAPMLVDSLAFEGSANVIHVSPTKLFVASPDGSWDRPTTTITSVDISDPAGAISAMGTFSVQGAVNNRFQLDEHEGTFRVVSHWGGWGEQGSQRLTVFDLTPGAERQLSTLDLPNTGGLFATRFDRDRAYLVTMILVDPLEIIDLRDPENPVLTYALEIPGVIQHIEPRGDRLLALGTDDVWSGVSASLFDVSDPQDPVMLSRVRVGDKGAWSNANWDHKALKVLDGEGMMLVPFSGWRSTSDSDWGGRYVNGFQIIEFDHQQLRARGVVEQEGQVVRTTAHRERLLSISDRILQTIDPADRDAPAVTARLELARNVVDLRFAGDHAVTLSNAGWSWEGSSTVLRVSARNEPEGTPTGSADIAFHASRLLGDDAGMLVLGWPSGWDGRAAVASVDLTEPSHPKVGEPVFIGRRYDARGSDYSWLNLDGAVRAANGNLVVPGYGYREVTGRRGSSWEGYQVITVVDPRTGEQGQVELPGGQAGELLVVGAEVWAGHVEVVEVSGGRSMGRYFVDRLDVSSAAKPRVLSSVNVPGELVGVANGGSTIFTRDYQWTASGQVEHALAELEYVRGRVKLRAYLKLQESVGRVIVRGSHLFATTARWWWNGGSEQEVFLRVWATSEREPLHEVSRQTVRQRMQLREVAGGYLFLGTGFYGGWGWGWDAGWGGAVADVAVEPGFGYWGWSVPESLMVYSLEKPDRPEYLDFVRTQGWVQGLTVDGSTAWVSSGMYGVQSIPLAR